ncbi:methylenetetrahydrofolate reductase [Neolewinella lacunae]|uniref:Methylenetetrahydrofolate reductase n=1 Tax=Neolewinella lacunae TaxID=1517758 RepID=A0A923PK77_9BACT|nr:methylenetetrahydrofolate reductase [Neolewinella lacunae]MBC6995580.1 methylenetetrahydrofolate reductase [Neolewinella lacunae]MDN3635616.1 methylenetetrahydrofolate reductase [Neolewinella lacunae]
MRVTDYFAQAKGNTLISFEVLPPLKGGSMQAIFDTLDPLMEFKPPFIDVTYHREEYVYKRRPSGYYEKSSIRKRPGTVGICAAIMHRYGVDAVPHLLCGGFTKQDTENALIDLGFLDVQNVLALRGDARKFEGKFIPEPDGHHYASDLVRQINDMNNGIYLDDLTVSDEASRTNFCIGVAGYPEKHFEAPNREIDLRYLKEKIAAGGNYIVTQMFFDNQKYFDFVDAVRAAGIDAPIVPGLKPLTKLYQLHSIPRMFYIDLPDDLVKAITDAKTDAARLQVGIEWCIAQSKELKERGAPCLHYYTMGDSSTIEAIAKAVY